MFFISQQKKVSRRPYCVVPMPKSIQKAHNHCHEHAHLLSDFLRKHRLHEYRFDFVQRTHTTYEIQGDIFFQIELITEELSWKCLLKVCGDKGGNWVYVLRHADISPKEIYDVLFIAFGGKGKVYPKNIFKEAVFRLRSRLSQ